MLKAKYFALLCVMVFVQSAFAGETSELKEKLDKIVQHSGLKKSDLGIYISEEYKKPVYELNGDKRFIPASITKLITAAAVMNAFSPYYKFHTQIWVDGEQNGSTLKGNIYLKGGGDPAFVSEKMWMLVNDFTRAGIKKVTGQIIVDESYQDDERVDPGREDSRNDRAYDAPTSGLSFNWNSTTIYVRPGAKAGEKAQAFVDPENDYVTLKNEVTTAKAGTDVSASKGPGGEKDNLVVQGKIAAGGDEKHIYKNVTNPALYAGSNFREFLRQRGIEVAGGTVTGTIPAAARMAADLEGEPLVKLITDMNKFSNNFVAEMLAKNLGAFKTGKQGHMSDGLNEVKKFLTGDLGWDAKNFNLVNVSGFTRKNSFSPEQFVQLLSWVQKQFKIYPEYVQSLPIASVDGTLHKRMKGAEGWVRAKTGLLNGVVALAGYAGRKDDGVHIFAFIYNGNADEGHVRDVFDSLATSLVK